MLQPVILVQQFDRGFGDWLNCFGGEVVERRQRLHLPGHHADLAIGHATVGAATRTIVRTSASGASRASRERIAEPPCLSVAKLIEAGESRQFERAAISLRKAPRLFDRLCQADAPDRHTGRESRQQPGWRLPVEQHEHAAIGGAADQAAEGLAQAQAGDAVVVALRIAVREMDAPLPMQNVRPWPGHPLEHHQTQCAARHIHAVAHRVGAQQAALLLGAEDVDQRGVAHRIDVLGVERDAGRLQFRRDARMHGLQPADGGEQAKRPAAGGEEQRAIGRGELGDVAARRRR